MAACGTFRNARLVRQVLSRHSEYPDEGRFAIEQQRITPERKA